MVFTYLGIAGLPLDFSTVTEPPLPPNCFIAEILYQIQDGFNYRHKQHLAYTFTGLYNVCGLSSVKKPDLNFTLVIRIYNANRICQHDSLIYSQT